MQREGPAQRTLGRDAVLTLRSLCATPGYLMTVLPGCSTISCCSPVAGLLHSAFEHVGLRRDERLDPSLREVGVDGVRGVAGVGDDLANLVAQPLRAVDDDRKAVDLMGGRRLGVDVDDDPGLGSAATRAR